MTAEKIIEIAMAEVGYKEKKSAAYLYDKTANAGSGNFTKYWSSMCPDYQGSAWCQCFVDWVFKTAMGDSEARKFLGQFDGWTFYTPSAVGFGKIAGLWHSGVKDICPGAIIYFYGYVKSEKKSRVHHVGIVYKVDSKKVYTIEGNAGDGVVFREYSLTDPSLYGYILPAYEKDDEEAAVGWHKDKIGWWYRYKRGHGAGTFYQMETKEINGVCYSFDREGYLITDVKKIGIDAKSGGIYVR